MRGYNGYRGRDNTGKTVLVVLLVLVLCAALAFLFTQDRIVYGEDGSMRIELFGGRRGGRGTGETDEPEVTVSRPWVSETETDTAPTVEDEEVIHAVELPDEALRGGAKKLLTALEGSEVNAVAVRLKETGGALLYPSKVEAAQKAGAVRGSSIALAGIDDIMSTDCYTIARISTLHDSLFSFSNMTESAVLQLQHPGYIWYDPESTFFLAPEKQAARQYIADIAAEIASLGFDELLFDDYTYPYRGRLDNIDSSSRGMSKSDALVRLAEDIRAAVGDNVLLSVELNAQTVLSGADEKRGQDVAALAAVFDRVYVSVSREQENAVRHILNDKGAGFVLVGRRAARGSYLCSSEAALSAN